LRQFYLKFFLSVIGQEKKLVETGMGCWQFILILIFVTFNAYDKFDVFETRNGSSVRSSRKGQKLSLLFICEFGQYNFPEPDDKLVLWVQWLHVLGDTLE